MFLVQCTISNPKEKCRREIIHNDHPKCYEKTEAPVQQKVKREMNGGCGQSGFVVYSGWKDGMGRRMEHKELDVG